MNCVFVDILQKIVKRFKTTLHAFGGGEYILLGFKIFLKDVKTFDTINVTR